MHRAIENGNVAAVRSILASGIDPNLREDSRASPTFLTQAARLNQEEIVSLLLASGADVNGADGDDMTPLIHASENGYVDIVELLLKAGADVHAQTRWGDTALSLAKEGERKYADINAILIKAGAK